MSSIFGIGANGVSEFYPFKINNSLRVDRGEGGRLSDTMGTPTNTDIATISVWVKRGSLTGVNQSIIEGYDGSSGTASAIYFDTSNRLHVAFGGGSGALVTNARFRDVSAWYHIHVLFDSSQSTSSDRCKIYVNGQQITSFSSSSYPSQNQNNHMFSSGANHRIGSNWNSTGNYFDGYMADFNGIDGTALDPSSFGQTKSGVWIPKNTSGLTFGNNGFRLQFGDNSDIGNDTSGNNNDWTPLALTTHDVVPDSPTLNYATLNPIGVGRGSGGSFGVGTLTEANLKYNTMGGGLNVGHSTFQLKGKVYFETLVLSRSGSSIYSPWIGVADIGNDYYAIANASNNGNFAETGESIASNTGFTYTLGDIIGVEFDEANNTIKWYKNGTLGLTRSPQNFNFSDFDLFTYYNDNNPAVSFNVVANFGQDSTFAGNKTTGSANATDSNGYGDFYYTPSTDFLALNSANIVEPSITPLNDELPEDYFESNLWTGNGTSQSISYEFAPDWVWMKERSSTSSYMVQDTIRGTDVFIQTNSEIANTATTTAITSFDSNGFTLGSGNSVNQSSQTYVGWAWLAGGSASSNTNGSITSTVSANQKAGFSIVKYTGTGSNATVGHGLSSAPDMLIVKRITTDGTNWAVYHTGLTDASYYLWLNFTNAQAVGANIWNSTDPTSSVFSVGTSSNTNSSAKDYIAYCFHEVEGYSKFGSYTGNGSTNGAFVYTGFRPSFIMHKRTNSTGDWFIFDNKRLGYNPENYRLRPNADNDTEADPGEYDILSNGFKPRFTSGNVNASGGTYIYMAFAEMPFKYANAR